MNFKVLTATMIAFLGFSSLAQSQEVSKTTNVQNKKEIVTVFDRVDGFKNGNMVCYKPEGFKLQSSSNFVTRMATAEQDFFYKPTQNPSDIYQYVRIQSFYIQREYTNSRDILESYTNGLMKRLRPGNVKAVIVKLGDHVYSYTSSINTTISNKTCQGFLAFTRKHQRFFVDYPYLVIIHCQLKFDMDADENEMRDVVKKKLLSLIQFSEK